MEGYSGTSGSAFVPAQARLTQSPDLAGGNTSGASAVHWVLSCPMLFAPDDIIFQLVGGVSFSTSTAEGARV